MKSRLFLFVLAVCCAEAAVADDFLRQLQTVASSQNLADWGHWGPNPAKYSSWTSHSNRLIPLYTFGMDLSSVNGAKSIYRDENRLKDVYGFLPEQTVNPDAEYFDQTDVYRLQKLAVAEGKTCIVLVVFDGMDWQTTRAAAVKKSGRVGYSSGRGSGLHFQDYQGTKTDFGFFVTSPHNDGTTVSVDGQTVGNAGGNVRGGYEWHSAGATPWEPISDAEYPIGKGSRIKHAYTDSSSSATSLTCGIKTYNAAMNVDILGRQVTPIARTLQEDGFAVGVVTSVPISHATPGCAYANNVHRDDYQDLTRDLLGVPSISHPVTPLDGVDVLIGAGWGEKKTKDGSQGENFVPGNRYLTDDDRKLIDAKTGGRYRIAERTAGASGKDVLMDAGRDAIVNKRRLFGYFGVAGGHLPFQTADGGFDPAPGGGKDAPGAAEKYSAEDLTENPHLADMAVTALDVLASRSDRIWLMVEAGDVDWANHQNNIDNSIGAVMSGDDAFLAVAQWIERHVGWDKAAVLLTADHGHYLVLDKPEALLGTIGN